ncbi:MAG: iron complex outermembrane receptor protein [Glaciecola sp.]|jgi:iron complex outermembrane receptor protein
MYFRLLILVSFLLLTQLTIAQHAITGTLSTSETKEAIPFANVILYELGSDSIVKFTGSDLKGLFVLKDLPAGKYRLSIDFIGMKSYTIDSLAVYKTIHLGELSLNRTVELEEALIQSEKPQVELKLDRKTFNVSDNPANEGGNASDVLSNLPSVDVDQDGNISMRGSSELRILIDGKPTGLKGEDIGVVLAQIPANTIKDIEIITVPTAKYDAESAGGIINIILKENKRKGTSGNINASYGTLDRVNLSTLVGIKKEKISLHLSYGLRTGTYKFDRYSLSKNSTIDSLNQFTIIGEGNKKQISHLGKVKLNFKISSKSELGTNSVISAGNSNNRRITDYLWEFNTIPYHLSTRDALTDQNKLNLVNSIYYNRKLKNDGKLSLSSTYAHALTNSLGNFTEATLIQEETNDLIADDYTQNLDFTVPRKKLKWEFGSQYTHRIIKNEFLYQSDDPTFGSLENNFDYYDDITAAYIMPSVKLVSWSVTAGYRIEHINSSSKNSSTNLDVNRNYFMHFPSFNLSKKLNDKNELGANYSRRITRPNARQLNPSASLADPYSLHVGNPNITPATNDVSEVTWLRKSKKITFQSTLFYQIRKNRVRRIRFVDDQGVSTVKWVNYKGEDYYGFEIFTSYRPHKSFTVNASANIYERDTDGSNISEQYVAKYYGWDSKINMSLKLPKQFLIVLKGEYKSATEIVIGTIGERYHMDFSLQKKLLKKKAKLTVRLADIFNTKQFRIATLVDNWDQSGTYKRESRILYISFNYNFGEMKNKKTPKIKNLRQTN